jgi:hypothetical protein
MKYDHLIQVSVAYARFVSRQRERGKVLGKGIRNVGTGSVLSLSTGNPFPIATSLAYEGYKWWSRSQEEKDAFLRINAKGRLVGKDGSEDLQDPKTAKRAEIFFTSDALKQWKSGTDLASDAQASAYYNQIDLLLRHESLGGYRDASKLASAAQAKLVRHVGTIRKPKPKLSVEERKKLTDRKSTLEEKINTIDSELVGLNSQIVDAKDTWDELQRGLAGVPQNQRAALEQNVIKARQAHSALVARSLRLTDERRVADGYLHDPDKGIEKKLQDDEHSEGAVQTLDELDNSPAFEKAFCVWVNNHLEHTPTRARAIAGSTVRAPVARIIVREFKNAVVATAGSAATGAVIGFGGSLIPGLNVVVNPGVFASVGAIAGAAGFIKSAAKRMLDGSFFRIEAAPTSPTPTNPQTPAPPASGSASH